MSTARSPDFDIPVDEKGRDVWSKILKNLWIGGVDPKAGLSTPIKGQRHTEVWPFEATLTLYPLAHPVPWWTTEYRYGFADGPIEDEDINELFEAAAWAYRRWKSGDTTLIRCRRGINRSAMLLALVLMIDGYTPTRAINLIRKKRSPSALFNPDFEEFLRSSDVCARIERLKTEV